MSSQDGASLSQEDTGSEPAFAQPGAAPGCDLGVFMGFCVGEGDCLPVYSKPSNRIENVSGLVFVEIMI